MCFYPFINCMIISNNFGITTKLPTNPSYQLFGYISVVEPGLHYCIRFENITVANKGVDIVVRPKQVATPQSTIFHIWVPDLQVSCSELKAATLIARFVGPTWGPPGAGRTKVGRVLATWTLLYEYRHQGDSHGNGCRASCPNPTIFKSYIFVRSITVKAKLGLNHIGQTFNKLMKSSPDSILVNQNCTGELLLKTID